MLSWLFTDEEIEIPRIVMNCSKSHTSTLYKVDLGLEPRLCDSVDSPLKKTDVTNSTNKVFYPAVTLI